jgi:pimeloyl-ACP methyl ester carboxylesterase
MSRAFVILSAALIAVAGADEPNTVRVALSASSEVDLGELVGRVAEAAGIKLEKPAEAVWLPVGGLAGALTFDLLRQSLGPEVTLALRENTLDVTLPKAWLEPEGRAQLETRLKVLAARAGEEARRRSLRFGMHARPSYRPNDPERPTVCLVHGLNSSSQVFVHMFGPLEEAGFGIVVYDFPYNRDLDQTTRDFARDWAAFRKERGDKRPWAIVAHSMGALLARYYVESDPAYGCDVTDMILIAPVNQGSGVSHAQTILQLVQSADALKNQQGRALARLTDGLGAAATDMAPGSAFLKALNSRPRRAGVKYHILAGDSAWISPTLRKRIEAPTAGLKLSRGLFGDLARLASDDLSARLDEITQGLGDGCVSVASTRLEGVADHVTIHANHLELIRAPLFFPDPGPVACMPFVLRWLKESNVR